MVTKRTALLPLIALLLCGCICVTKQQHAAVTTAFKVYVERTEDMVERWANSAAKEEVRKARMGWLTDAKEAVTANERLSKE